MKGETMVTNYTIRSEYLNDIVQCFQDLLYKKPKALVGQEKHSEELYGPAIDCVHETPVSRDIRILSEVEKIWIIYDIDGSGKID